MMKHVYIMYCLQADQLNIPRLIILIYFYVLLIRNIDKMECMMALQLM